MFEQKYHIYISHDTITRRLHENKFSFVKPRTVQALTPEQIIVRNNFANRMLNYDLTMYRMIIFSDESRFSSGPDNSCHWRQKDDFSPRTTAHYSKHPVSTMVWGAIGFNYKSRLYFHDGGVRSTEYMDCLKSTNIFGDLNTKIGCGRYIFQQDGATCHQTSEIIDYLRENCRVLHGWPPNSPDLSPIEMIWAIIKRKLSQKNTRIRTKSQLKQAIQDEWDAIPMNVINKLIDSFHYRLEMCAATGGETISHFLSGGKKKVDVNYQQQRNPISENEKNLIYSLYCQKKRKWKKISNIIQNELNVVIHPLIVKHVALELDNRLKDLKKFGCTAEEIPEDLLSLLSDEEIELITNININENEDIEPLQEEENDHIVLNIEREEDEIFENSDSDWCLSEDDNKSQSEDESASDDE